jgi:hypothetical protein
VEWVLTANDRCDATDCGAQAYVKATGVSGSLYFCGHHYEKIVNTVTGYDKMMNFAFSITDERDRLIVNKSKGDDY